MSLVMKGKVIPLKEGSLIMLGQKVTKLQMEGITVWQVARQRVVFLATQIFTVPVGVTQVTVCICGGGGGGSVGGLGGASGQILTNVLINVAPESTILVTIGEGGVAETDGADTSFGTLITALGGVSNVYQGDGDYYVKCGKGAVYDGTYDGVNYGGQSGAFGDGGNGALDGSSGAGGGGGGSGTTSAGSGGSGGVSIIYTI